MDGRCDWGNPNQLKRPGCKTVSDLLYLGRELCNEHWHMLCEWQGQGREDAAYKKIGLKPRKAKPVVEVVEDEEDEPEEALAVETPALPQRPRRRKRRR